MGNILPSCYSDTHCLLFITTYTFHFHSGYNHITSYKLHLTHFVFRIKPCIMMKELSRILPPFQIKALSAPEALELRIVSATVDNTKASEEEQPKNNENTDSYSVGLMTGVLTILAITFGMVFSLMIFHKASNLMFLMVEMIIRILIPLIWFVRNNAIIRATFG